MNRLVLALLLSLAVLAVAEAAPRGTVIVKRTQQEFSDVEWEINGQMVEVKFAHGSRFWRVTELLLVPVAESGGGEVQTRRASRANSVAWHARCRLALGDEWAAIHPTAPNSLIELLHADSGARINVALIPVDSDFQFSGRGGTVGTWVKEDIALNFHKIGRLPVVKETFFGADVYVVGPATVRPIGWERELQLHQLRFRRFGFEYVITITAAKDDEGTALLAQADELYRAFTFLPAVTRSTNLYSDFGHGFSIRRPAQDWAMTDRPFAAKRPVSLSIDGGRGEVKVSIHDEDSATSWVRQMLAKRSQKSRYYAAERVETGEQDGTEVERFQFEDFNEGGRKKLRFRGFAANLQGKVVSFIGVSPLTDSDARKLQEEVDKALDSVKLLDIESLSGRIETKREIASKVSLGFKALVDKRAEQALPEFEDALRLQPGLALAHFLRGEARRITGDFDGFREDLDRAVELDPEGGYAVAVAPSYAAEARDAEKANNYPRALEMWGRAYRLTNHEDYLKGLVKSLDLFWRHQMNPNNGEVDVQRTLLAVERACRRYEDEPLVNTFLANTYAKGAEKLRGKRLFAKAKRWAKKLRSMPGQRERGEKLYDNIRKAEKR